MAKNFLSFFIKRDMKSEKMLKRYFWDILALTLKAVWKMRKKFDVKIK